MINKLDIVKKITICIMLLMLICCKSFVCAQEPDETQPIPDEIEEQYNELLNSSGADNLFDILPKDGKILLSENNITGANSNELMGINFFGFLKTIWQTMKNTIRSPLTILLSSIGIILLCSLINSLKSGFNNASYERVFSVVSVICIATTVILPISNMITKTADIIKQVSTFLLGFIPVYAGIITASGKPISAVAYQVGLIGIIQVISRIAATVLVPLLAIYLAFCLIGATSSHIQIDNIAKSVKTIVITVLGFLLTIFVGLITAQGFVGNAADSVTMKTAKFAIGTFLPVVGSAISEALSSVYGCMGVLKSTVGGFGIVAVIASFLPSVIAAVLMQLSLNIAAGISDMLDTNRIGALLRSAACVVSMLVGIMMVFFVLMIVSVAIMLTINN